MTSNLKVFLEKIRKETFKVDTEYVDISGILSKKGPYNQVFTTLMYAESETRGLLYFLWLMKEAIKIENSDIETLRLIFKKLLNQIIEFNFSEKRMGFKYTTNLLKEMENLVNENISREDLISIIKALIQFVGKINFRIDREIPWHLLIETYKEYSKEHPSNLV
jgi:hypothetical protein